MSKPRAKSKPLAAAQPSANPDRGEHELTLGGTTYVLRPSHSAIRAIERKTERSMLALARLGNTGDMSLLQAAIVASEFINAGGENVHADRIGELIFETGIAHPMATLTLCLMDAATGGRTAQGEAKAAAA